MNDFLDWDPAFPSKVSHDNGTVQTFRGISRCEYFAAHALQGIIARGQEYEPERAAKAAVQFARALIKELS